MLNKPLVYAIVVSSMSLLAFSALAYDDDNYHDDGNDAYESNADHYDFSGNHGRYYQSSHRHSSYGKSVPHQISGGNIIRVNLSNQTWAAYDHGGSLLRSGHVSGGKKYCPDIGRRCRTVTGTFTIYSKKGAGCKSTIFPVGRGGAPMPYCMFFHGGYALHGSNAVPDYNASHGCVRMSPSDARWLNQNFVQVGRTRVSIHY